MKYSPFEKFKKALNIPKSYFLFTISIKIKNKMLTIYYSNGKTEKKTP